MKLAVTPKAGFFALFIAPKRAFGENLQNAAEFNNLMIARTGIVGVPFGEYIRYSVAQTDVLADANKIREAFQSATVEY